MWLITTQGFYSAVEDNRPDSDLLKIRARVKGDLENLRTQIPNLEIVEGGGTDYPFRAYVTKIEWERAVAELAAAIDYGNFKDEVKKKQGAKRARVYEDIWVVLYGLMPKRWRHW